MNTNPEQGFFPLTGLYEPSAIVQLADGRFLVVEDEKEHPFSLVQIDLRGRVVSTPLTPGWFEGGDGFWKLDDLEGLALDRSGAICAITSQSLAGDGDRKKAREKLVRFRVEGDRVEARQTCKGLKAALVAAFPALAAAAEVADVKGGGGLNVEALEFQSEADGRSLAQQRLLVGFRSPLIDERAVIAVVENPDGMFERDEAPRVGDRLVTLDLGGNGIRGMGYVPDLHGFLLIGGPVSKASAEFGLWFWNGNPDGVVCRVEPTGVPDIAHAEGICPAIIDGQPRIVLVSDDGDRKAGRPARFLLLEPGQLMMGSEVRRPVS